MSTPAAPNRRGSRTDTLLSVFVFALAASFCLGLIAYIGERTSVRLDMTATGSHRLSDRSETVLKTASELGPGWELVLAIDAAGIDPRDREDVLDVLDVFAQQPGFARTTIDTGSAQGSGAFIELLQRLAERDAAALDQHARVLSEAVASLERLTEAVPAISDRLTSLADAVPEDEAAAEANTAFFRERAATVRVIGDDLAAVIASARSLLNPAEAPPLVRGLRLARVDLAENALDQPFETVIDQLAALRQQLETYARATGFAEEPRRQAADLALALARVLTDVSNQRDAVELLSPPDLLRIEAALRASAAMLVIAPPGTGSPSVTAIDLEALFPDRAVLTQLGLAGADIRRRAEELITTAVGSLALGSAPVVVFTHGETVRFLDSQPVFRALVDRLARRGIDALEWATALEAEPPSGRRIDPLGERPRVYVTLAPDSSAPSPNAEDTSMSGAARLARYADAVERLLDAGDSVLLSLNPSVLPGFGEDDPQNRLLRRFGLRAETGRPLLREIRTPDATLADPDLSLVASSGSDHPLARATEGLRATLPWPVEIIDESGDAQPLIDLPEASLWSESEWLRLWRTPRQNRPFMTDQPAFSATLDSRPATGALAFAAERSDGISQQRFVVIGSNSWHVDPITTQAVEVDGRVSQVNPANTELIEASIEWLAGRDQLIGRSARAGATPRVKPIDAGLLGRLRLALALGPAGLVLVVGLFLAFARRD